MLAATALAVIRIRSLFAVVMLFGIYSLLTAVIFVALDAVDVAFTEAAVGAGISTVLMLGTLVIAGRRARPTSHTPVLPLIIVFITGAMLVWGTFDMPYFADPANPVHQHVAPRFIYESPQEVGIPNMVTSVLASYRGYDTFGELIVVFTALVGVMALLGIPRTRENRANLHKSSNPILIVGAIWIIPFILLFALYVQFHGDFGPGGGFQAGVIFCSGFVLYSLTFGIQKTMLTIKPKVLIFAAVFGVLLYGGTGVVSMLKGGHFLDYNVLSAKPQDGQHIGILLVELGVGITVASVMILIFFAIVQSINRKFLRRIDDSHRHQETIVIDIVIGLYNYWVAIFLMMAGFYTVIASDNLVKKIVGLNIFQTSVFILYISLGKVQGGSPPIHNPDIDIYANPLPHVLILTAIVVGVATTALGLSLIIRIKNAYGSVEETDIIEADESQLIDKDKQES